MASPLDDDKAPYLLALLISAFTWHVGQISAKLTQANSVSYELVANGGTNQLKVTLANISDDKFLRNNRFQFSCPDGEPCIVVGSVRPDAVHPVHVIADIQESSTDVAFTVSLPPDSQFQVLLNRVEGTAFPDFLYAPLPETMSAQENGGSAIEHDGIVLLQEGSWRVFAIRHYIAFVSTSFFLVFLLLCFVAGRWLWRTAERKAVVGGSDK